MSQGAAPPPGLLAGRVVGIASLVSGSLLTLLWIGMRFSVRLVRTFAFIPFFDHKRRFDDFGLLITHLVVALLLVGVGLLILQRRRWAVPAFLVCGWGGLLFSLVALWPGDQLRREMELGLKMAQRMGRAAPDATFYDLILQEVPPAAWAGLGAFLLVWLALLTVGTVHLLRQRRHYAN